MIWPCQAKPRSERKDSPGHKAGVETWLVPRQGGQPFPNSSLSESQLLPSSPGEAFSPLEVSLAAQPVTLPLPLLVWRWDLEGWEVSTPFLPELPDSLGRVSLHAPALGPASVLPFWG